MYELVKKTPGVWNFNFSKEALVSVIKKNNNYHLTVDDQPVEGMEIVNPNPICLVSGNQFYYSDYDGHCYEIDLVKKERRLVADRYIALLDNQGDEFLVKTKNGSARTALMNLRNGSVQCDFDINVANFLVGSALFCNPFRVYTSLNCYDKATGNKNWEIDVAEKGSWLNGNGEKTKGEIVNIIGEYKSSLIVHITKDRLIAADVQSGKIEWEQDNFLSCAEGQEHFLTIRV